MSTDCVAPDNGTRIVIQMHGNIQLPLRVSVVPLIFGISNYFAKSQSERSNAVFRAPWLRTTSVPSHDLQRVPSSSHLSNG